MLSQSRPRKSLGRLACLIHHMISNTKSPNHPSILRSRNISPPSAVGMDNPNESPYPVPQIQMKYNEFRMQHFASKVPLLARSFAPLSLCLLCRQDKRSRLRNSYSCRHRRRRRRWSHDLRGVFVWIAAVTYRGSNVISNNRHHFCARAMSHCRTASRLVSSFALMP